MKFPYKLINMEVKQSYEGLSRNTNILRHSSVK